MKQSYSQVRCFLLSLFVLLSLSLAGCWSSNEIEEVSLGVGLAFDKGMESKVERELREKGGGYPKKDLITTTFQIINPQASGAGTRGGGAAQQKPYLNVSETGDSVHQIVREFSLRTDRPFVSQHLKVIVFGEDLVRRISLEPLTDQMLRDNQIRPSSLILISKGRASETLETKKGGEVPAFRLHGIVDNQYRSTRIMPPMSLAKLEGKIQSGSSFMLQNVIAANREIKFAGAAVIKGRTNKLIGFLNETELEGIMWITGKGSKGGVVKSFDKQTEQLIVYEIKSMKSKITPRVNGSNISFDVNIESEGRLSEDWVESGDPFDNEFLKRAEKAAEEEVNRLVHHVTKKMQNEYITDVAGFGNQLRIEHPKLWEKVKADWDQIFSKVPIKYNVKLTITDYGTLGSKK
ncbi:Ger(x)C family spore germination protein [Brevibacillus dissolubilis]|uniref:Ger(x)C family spore germination protein n=1 Tax=Brevibacillus dissolubilis TaxID=1844116 RepID=UPI001116F9FB|nr:Ger(x)C family spore germination protein [Brevibacillus dissolubilis]